MHGGCVLMIGTIVSVACSLLGMKLTADGQLLLGFVFAAVGLVGGIAAYIAHDRRLEFEIEKGAALNLAKDTHIGMAIPLWILFCVGAMIYPLVKWMGWIE